jgi:hypothetical protein
VTFDGHGDAAWHILTVLLLLMDCRVKPGNDEMMDCRVKPGNDEIDGLPGQARQ